MGFSIFGHCPTTLVNSRTKEGKSSTANKKQNIKSTWFRAGTAGQFLQTVVLQVETAEATETPKKTFWKCSQAIALQLKFPQATEIPKKTFWKRSQFVALQVKLHQASEIPKKTFWKCSQFVAPQVKSVHIFQAIEHSSRKLSQIHVFQIQGATPAT